MTFSIESDYYQVFYNNNKCHVSAQMMSKPFKKEKMMSTEAKLQR